MNVQVILSKEIDDTDQGKDFYEKIKELVKDEVNCRMHGSINNNIPLEDI